MNIASNAKEDFPIFENNPGLIYFDNGATSQKPKTVIEAMDKFYNEYNSNVHRGIHKLSERATDEYEKAREEIAKFINAKPNEIVFAKNCTEALNLVSYSLRKKITGVTTSIMEHHSNFVPWQQLAKRKNLKFNIIDIDEDGLLKNWEEELKKTKSGNLTAITHASNVLGTINDIENMAKIVHDLGGKIIADACQSVPHLAVDTKKLDADFLAFSSHKMLGPTGIGVLYVKEGLEKEMEPFLYGGDMINRVYKEDTKFAEMPGYFEAGTPPICEAIGLAEAVRYLKKIGMENIREHEIGLIKKCMLGLQDLEINVIGPKDADKKTGLVAFTSKNMHPHDIAQMLDRKNIAIRSGMHCAHPLHDRLGIPASSRASFYLYNTEEEIELFLAETEKIEHAFRK